MESSIQVFVSEQSDVRLDYYLLDFPQVAHLAGLQKIFYEHVDMALSALVHSSPGLFEVSGCPSLQRVNELSRVFFGDYAAHWRRADLINGVDLVLGSGVDIC